MNHDDYWLRYGKALPRSRYEPSPKKEKPKRGPDPEAVARFAADRQAVLESLAGGELLDDEVIVEGLHPNRVVKLLSSLWVEGLVEKRNEKLTTLTRNVYYRLTDAGKAALDRNHEHVSPRLGGDESP